MTKDILVTSCQLANCLNLSDRRIRQLAEKGFPKNGDKFYLLGCVKFYIQLLQKRDSEDKTRLTKAKADQAEIDLLAKQKKLIPIDDVVFQTSQSMQIFKARVFEFPSRLAPKLEEKSKEEIYYILDTEIKKWLNDLAKDIEDLANKLTKEQEG